MWPGALSALSAALSPVATSVDKGECVGGATLSLLHDRSFSYTGDSQAQELCLYLTTAASVPYFEILEKWIYRGIIDDPYRWAGAQAHVHRVGDAIQSSHPLLSHSPPALSLSQHQGLFQ